MGISLSRKKVCQCVTEREKKTHAELQCARQKVVQVHEEVRERKELKETFLSQEERQVSTQEKSKLNKMKRPRRPESFSPPLTHLKQIVRRRKSCSR